MSQFARFDANPFGLKKNDCVIRSLVAGTLFGYKTVCEMLGVEFFPGVGLSDDGVDIGKVEEFSKKTGIIVPLPLEFKEGMDITTGDLRFLSKYGGFSVRSWTDKLSGYSSGPRIIFQSKTNPYELIPKKDQSNFHQVYANVRRKTFYDTFDSGDTVVFAAYYVDPTKVARPDDPRYFANERDLLRKERDEYLKGRLGKKKKS